ncbi:MAG: hypothetical protein K2X77_00460 [Candidatus Obscuribacterales bacterium]|jgi:hypothetical protein|nr:hypothetical protein [Candidatus Obscuribacterales bacterium]
MNKKVLGITIAASAMLAGFVFLPSAEAQTAQGEALARLNAQEAAEGEAALGESMGIPRAFNQISIQKKYNDTYNAQMRELAKQSAISNPYASPYTVAPTAFPYPYGTQMRTSGRILNWLF